LEFSGQENGLRIQGAVIAHPEQYHLVRYTNTDETFLYNLNDSVATIELKLSIQRAKGWEDIALLESHGAQIEFVTPSLPSEQSYEYASKQGRTWLP